MKEKVESSCPLEIGNGVKGRGPVHFKNIPYRIVSFLIRISLVKNISHK